MSLIKTYIDSGVLITYFRGSDELVLKAATIIERRQELKGRRQEAD